MQKKQIRLNSLRKKRVMRVRKRLRGTAERPRLSVVKTNKHLLVQLIDDVKGVTLLSTGTLAKEFRSTEYTKKNKKTAEFLGKHFAEKAKEKQIVTVIFDRGKSRYHGVLAAFADAARQGGLEF